MENKTERTFWLHEQVLQRNTNIYRNPFRIIYGTQQTHGCVFILVVRKPENSEEPSAVTDPDREKAVTQP